MDLKNLSSNWKKLQASGTLRKSTDALSNVEPKDRLRQKTGSQGESLKRKRSKSEGDSRPKSLKPIKKPREMSNEGTNARQSALRNAPVDDNITKSDGQLSEDRTNEGLARHADIGRYLAIDCEMVGVGPNPHLESALARVSIANYNGEQVYDSYVKPQEEVTDWRTHVSGIQPKHMVHARSFEEAQADVATLIKGRIIVGHSIRSDFDALLLDHPRRDIRDTARHPPYRKLAGGGSPKLKILASELLGLDIQNGEHSSIEDARATMLLFRRDKDAFEREHIKRWGPPVAAKKANEEPVTDEAVKKPKKKKKKKR